MEIISHYWKHQWKNEKDTTETQNFETYLELVKMKFSSNKINTNDFFCFTIQYTDGVKASIG